MPLAENAEPTVTAAERRQAALSDLRTFVRLAEQSGDLVHVDGADPHLEIGALYELSLKDATPRALLFGNVKGYAPGFRLLCNGRRTALLSDGYDVAAVQRYREERKRNIQPIPPEVVETGPVLDNVQLGNQVNVKLFPAPLWHEYDGGPYIGTECMVINKDPDTDWTNLGTYRAQVQDEKTISIFIEPGKQGEIIRQKYWDRGEPCPMALCVGQAPILGDVAGSGSKHGESEYATAGGRIGRAIDVVRGKVTGLLLPADAELVFEGYTYPPAVDARPEGPFGEWPGYYASHSRLEPVLRVEAVYYRDDPIITSDPPAKPTHPARQYGNVRTAAAIWDALEAAGVPGVKGVWKMQGGGSRLITVVAIEQMHSGHAKMAGLVATGCGPAAYLGRLTIVVDDDVDIANPVEVIWALGTRWDPKTQTDVIDGCWTGHIDPVLAPDKREVGDITNSRAIIYAVKPFHWKDEYPRVNVVDPAYAEQVRQKWSGLLPFLS